MHLADGTLPISNAIAYGAASGAYVAFGVRQYYKKSSTRLDFKILSGVFTAFVFISTIFEIPMPFGSSEHPTGTPLMSIFMGPAVTAFLSVVVLLLELLFKEGGITTLGANVFSLGIIGGLVGWGVFRLSRKMKLGIFLAAFLAGFLGDLSVYLTTATQLAIGNMEGKSFYFYFLAFLPGQVPLAILEGVFTGLVLNFIYKRRPDTLADFKIIDSKR